MNRYFSVIPFLNLNCMRFCYRCMFYSHARIGADEGKGFSGIQLIFFAHIFWIFKSECIDIYT